MKLIIFITLLCFVTVKSNNFRSQNWEPDRGLPVKQDFETFLGPVESLMKYVVDNITHIHDIHLALGIFITNVHLGRALLDKGKYLPDDLYTRIKEILDTNEENFEYFRNKTKTDDNFMTGDNVKISYLFSNTTYSIHRIKNFNYEKERNYTKNDLELIYSSWKEYVENVNNVYDWQPSPTNSDICLVSVAIQPKGNSSVTSWCPVPKMCYNILIAGSEFGYALCHRILLLILANIGHGCYVLSVEEDEEFKEKFCSMAYAEAVYIAMNDYDLPDLMFEIICVCAVDGSVQFLNRSWLLELLDFQTEDGCFGPFDEESKICNSHTTALASGTYAAAVRFILEEFY